MPRALALLVAAVSVQAQPEDAARALVNKAIEARGGADKLARLKVMTEKTRGKLFVKDDVFPVTGESFVQFPSQFRMIFKVRIKGEEYAQTRVLDGARAWSVDIKGEVREVTGKELDELRQDLFHDDLLRLSPLVKNKDIRLSLLKGTKVEGKPALGVKASAAGKRDLELYFDKETHLLVKMARDGYDADAGFTVPQVQLYSDYKLVDGIRYPMKWVSYQDGKKSMEVEVTQVRFPDTLPADTFAKPEKK